MAFEGAGHTYWHVPHPMQSDVSTCEIRLPRPGVKAGRGIIVMAFRGHCLAQRPHPMQLAGSDSACHDENVLLVWCQRHERACGAQFGAKRAVVEAIGAVVVHDRVQHVEPAEIFGRRAKHFLRTMGHAKAAPGATVEEIFHATAPRRCHRAHRGGLSCSLSERAGCFGAACNHLQCRCGGYY